MLLKTPLIIDTTSILLGDSSELKMTEQTTKI